MKYFFFTLFSISIAFSVQAQGLVIGAIAGINKSHTKINDAFSTGFSRENDVTLETEGRIGFQGGIRLGLDLGERVMLLSDISFVQRGGRMATVETGNWVITDRSGKEIIVDNGIVKWDERYSAVQVPLLLRVKILGNRLGLTGTIGPSLNFNIAGKGEVTVEDALKSYSVSDAKFKFGKDRFDDYSKIDFSIVLGPGLTFNLDEDGYVQLTLDARFDIGLVDMYSSKRRTYLEGINDEVIGSRKHRSSMLTLGFNYCLTCNVE